MNSLIHNLTITGSLSLRYFWTPLLIWTVFTVLMKVTLHYSKRLSARHQYHFHLALLAALPLGYLSYTILHALPAFNTVATSISAIRFELPVTVTSVATTTPRITLTFNTWIGLIVLVLASGILYMTIRLINSLVKLRQYSRKLELSDQDDISMLSRENRDLVHSLRRNVRFAFISRDNMPMAFGLFHPVIVLPGSLKDDTLKLNLTVSHELEHIRRHDYLRFWLIRVLRAFFWFHPLVWKLEKDAVLYGEMDIDETVITHNKNLSSEYAHLLLKLADSPNQHYLLPTGLAMRPSTIKRRITAMTSVGNIHKSRWVPACLTIMTLLITVAMGCTGMQNQDLSGEKMMGKKISFNNPTIQVNGAFIDYNPSSTPVTVEGPALGLTYMVTPMFGTFVFSGQSFDKAQPIGKVNGNKLSFQINELQVTIVSKNDILPEDNATLWVRHDADIKSSNFKTVRLGWISNVDGYQQLRQHNFGMIKSQTQEKTASDSDVFLVVEKMPQLIGGMQSLASRIEYPEKARKEGIEGKVIVQFIVDEHGNVTDPQVVKSIGHGFDQAALKAVRELKFTPGTQRGKAVKVQYSLPINFKL